MTDTERRELTAAELDLVAGGDFYDLLISSVMDATDRLAAHFHPDSGAAGTGNGSGSAMFDVRQNRAG